MKQAFILWLLMLEHCDSVQVVKSFINERNNTDDSLQVNVSAGYGVHSENISSPKFPERHIQTQNNLSAQIRGEQEPRISHSTRGVLPVPPYKVYEKSVEVPKDHFQMPKNRLHHSVEESVRHKNNGVNLPIEYKESLTSNYQYPQLAAGTKIIEVLRVPATYELHLQSDPQRLNSAWFDNLNAMMSRNQYRHPPVLGGRKNLIHQTPIPNFSYTQPISVPPQKLGRFKQRIVNQNRNGHNSLRTKNVEPQIASNAYSTDGFTNNFSTAESHQNSYRLSPEKPTQKFSVQAPLNYQQVSNEISSDYYQKPQALHEVPAPVLTKQHYKNSYLPRIKAVSSPDLVYRKRVGSLYQTSNESPRVWDGTTQDRNNENYQRNETKKGLGSESKVYVNKRVINVNGETAAYLNTDGPVTVSNSFHNGTENGHVEPGNFETSRDWTKTAQLGPNSRDRQVPKFRYNYSRNIPKLYTSQRRNEPLDYILYIKEKIVN